MNIKFSLFAVLLTFVTFSCKSEASNATSKTVKTNVKTEVSERTSETKKVAKAEMKKDNTGTTKVTVTSNSESIKVTAADSKPTAPKVIEEMPKKMADKKEEVVNEVVEKVVEKTPIVKEVKEEIVEAKPVVVEEKTTVKEEVVKVVEESKPVEIPVAGAPSHTSFAKILKSNVSSSGNVNYAGIKANASELNKYIAMLEGTSVESSWSKDEKLAFWINAYNAYTIRMIIENYPVKSITDLHGGKPWDKKWIKLNGQTLSLNNIENDIIRPTFNDPRIHFAVNCAAKSCPPILNDAFHASSLNAQLNSQTKKFINDAKYNTLSGGTAQVSKIFDWYGSDFGNIAQYLSKYSDAVKSDATITFSEYDWNLNE